jgi:outer membrane lipoprotein LolB
MKKILFLLPFLCVLTGCINLHPPITHTTFQTIDAKTRQANLSKLSRWKIVGALSITQPGASPQIANYTWDQSSATQYQITLSSALNVYQLQIVANNGEIALFKNNVHVTDASTPEQLMQKAVGWSLPLKNLQYWIRGIPAPFADYTASYDRYGHLVRLTQLGFVVQYTTYQTNDAGLDVPELISMQSPAIFAKIVLKKFHTY